MTGVEVIAAILGSSGLSSVFTYLATRQTVQQKGRKEDHDFIREGFELAVKVVTDQRDDAFKQLESVRRELGEVQLEIVGLKLANSFDPFPRWMVDLEGKYIFINSCFEEHYLVPRNMLRRDLIGKGHETIWPPEFCEKVKHLDAVARARPDGRARAVFVLGGTECTIYKFPVRIQGTIVAYAGYMIENF